LKLSEYQLKALETDNIIWGEDFSADIPLLGIVGEIGSISTVLKKWQRDGVSYGTFEQDLFEELGDVLWYVVIVAHHLGIDIMFEYDVDIDKPIYSSQENVFKEFYSLSKNIPIFISLRDEISKGANISYTKNKDLVEDILLRIHNISDHFNSDIESIADANYRKTHDFWIGDTLTKAHCFDGLCPNYERMPRTFEIDVIETIDTKILMQINGVNVGDKLTDNSYNDDGYRFHDVFHVANIAALGWSPVFRRMLHRKRKSDALVDEVQDGARAAIIEELVVNQIYNYVRDHNYLATSDKVDAGLIKSITDLVRDVEVSICKPWEWRHCIIEGCRVFREIRKHQVGRISVDSDKRVMKFTPLSK